VNTLSQDELKTLREIYGQAEGAQKKILLQITGIRKHRFE
jgi:hypothetical protein